MRKVEFVPDARDEFMAEVAFYEAAQRGLGKKFSSSVEKAASLVSVFPVAGCFSMPLALTANIATDKPCCDFLL